MTTLLVQYRSQNPVYNWRLQSSVGGTISNIHSSFKKFLEFTGIVYRSYSMRDTVKKEINKYTLTSSVTLGMQSEGNALKNVVPTCGFSFTTMLQHTSRFW